MYQFLYRKPRHKNGNGYTNNDIVYNHVNKNHESPYHEYVKCTNNKNVDTKDYNIYKLGYELID